MERNHQNKNLHAALDDILADIRHETVDEAIVNAAADRVWARIASEPTTAQASVTPSVAASLAAVTPADKIHSCADFQTLIHAYLDGDLSRARRLLLEDHTHECIPCRKALHNARRGSIAATINPTALPGLRRTPAFPPAVWRWGMAASLIIGFSLLGWLFFAGFSSTGLEATVQAADGAVYRVSDVESVPVTIGQKIKWGERVRTAQAAHAVVRLADGSLVEMKERSELSVSESSRGVTINLERGNVIVQAAKQRQQPLYVATDEALVSVTGTIFSVNNGTKGSRVSVIEGEVHVNHNGREDVLHPGDQTTTSAMLETVPVKDEIAWSQDAQRYGELIGELAALRRELDQKVPRPGVRTSSRLLELVPAGTVLYAALPNLSATISESYRIMQERINQNPALREWWQNQHQADAAHGMTANDQSAAKSGAPSDLTSHQPEVSRIIESIRECGEYLGHEIVITAAMSEQGTPASPLVLAELKDAAGFRAFLEQQIKTWAAGDARHAPRVRFITDPLTLTSTATAPDEATRQSNEVFIWMNNDLFAAAASPEQLQPLVNAHQATAGSFTQTPFYARIADIYREGAGLIVAADLEKIFARLTREAGAKSERGQLHVEAFRKLGVLDLKHFIVEYKDVEGKGYNRASLTFNEHTAGIASWLAAPGPMGALEFISPEANVVAAFVVKDPVSLVGDLLGAVETAVPQVRLQLAEIEKQRGLDIRRDFAAPLGGECAFAIDGPLLPVPSWKMILEVHDPLKLQGTLERVVEEVNREAAKHGAKGFAWQNTESGGRTFYTLKSLDAGLELNYVYVNGYLVAAPSRALVERALQFRASEYTLSRSARFLSTLPADKNANFSAIFYHDLASAIEPFARGMDAMNSALPEQQQEMLNNLRTVAPPTLAYAYAQGDRIIFSANSSDGSPFGLSPAMLFGMPGSFGMQHILNEGVRAGSR